MSAEVRVARGPRAVEAGLLDHVAPWVEEAARSPERLARPVRIVVPSGSLRAHLAAALVRRFGAAAGVRVQTLHRLALDVLEAAGAPSPTGDALGSLVIRRLAARAPELSRRLEGLQDGYGIVAAVVTDLLDAGFEPVHRDAVEEAAGELAGGEVVDRVRAVLRVTAEAADGLAAEGLAHRSALFRQARELIEARGDDVLPTRALFVHGYADATGVQADLLECLLRRGPGGIWLDRPLDPASPEREDPGNAFGDRFSQRMRAALGEGAAATDPPPPPRVAVVHAPGLQAELRSVAVEVRSLLDAGVAPEGIGLVARHLGAYRTAIRQHFTRLGIPFSGVGAAAPPGPARRRIEGLLDLLRRRTRTPTERWLDLLDRLPRAGALSPAERADLLLALHCLGAGRIDDVARLDFGSIGGDLPLPQRLGFETNGERPGRARRRRLAGHWLRAAVEAAAGLRAHLGRWPARAPLADYRAALRALLRDDLGWSADSPEMAALEGSLLDDEVAAPGRFVLGQDELPALAERSLSRAADPPIGGAGAGVQVLDVMEARARTFDHLFVIGMNRGVFPRVISEDPLLPDALRRRLRVTLPDLPVKADGYDEERYLFAQLMSAAPAVTLSSARCDDDGKARPVSPLLDRLRWAPRVAEPRAAPALYGSAALESASAALRPAHEHAQLAGLYGARAHYANVLAVALGESARTLGVADARMDALAAGRVAVLAELDPSRARRSQLGPYFGFVGAIADAADPRGASLYVTSVETLAKCPWQGFLKRVLRLEPTPDPHAALPSAGDPLLIGALVHRVLEAIVGEALAAPATELSDAVGSPPVAVPWPGPERLDALLERTAGALAIEAGIGVPGFARVLALQARARLEVARGLDWPVGGDGFGAVAVEVTGRTRVRDRSGAEREIFFEADRVDRCGDRLRLVDYKSGKPAAKQTSERGIAREVHRLVRRGELLQGVAYALAGSQLGLPASEGRYLHLHPDALPVRTITTPADDAGLVEDFHHAVAGVLDAWDQGAFAPRLAEPGSDVEPRFCEYCEVKEACLRGDSGARRRLVDWLAAAPETPETRAGRALRGVWSLREDAR